MAFHIIAAHVLALGVLNLAENGTIYGYQNMGVYFAGAAHLLNHNAGVLRGTHGEQKSPVEQKDR
jgi:hypothetical protein